MDERLGHLVRDQGEEIWVSLRETGGEQHVELRREGEGALGARQEARQIRFGHEELAKVLGISTRSVSRKLGRFLENARRHLVASGDASPASAR